VALVGAIVHLVMKKRQEQPIQRFQKTMYCQSGFQTTKQPSALHDNDLTYFLKHVYEGP